MPSPLPAYDATGIKKFSIPQFRFASGDVLDVEVAYREWNVGVGKGSGSRGAVLIPTCFGGLINGTLNFHTGALSNHHVIVVAMLGNGESSSPSNTPGFPSKLNYTDNIRVQHKLATEHLNITSLTAVIGFSMGGQQAYHWGVMYGTGEKPFVKSIVCICTSAKTSGHNIAFLEGPICALEQSHDYVAYRALLADGIKPKEALQKHKPVWGLRGFGRAYAAWLTSPEWFKLDLWRKLGAESLEEWLRPWEIEGGAGRFEDWNPDDLLVLAGMWQAGDVGAISGGAVDWKDALKTIECRVLVMPSKTDQYFRWEASEEELPYLKHGSWAPIETVWGHIAGGGANAEDTNFMDEQIAKFLKGEDVSAGLVAETGSDVAS